MKETVLVLGASAKPERFSFMAVRKLNAYGHKVVAVGNRKGMIDSTEILIEIPTKLTIDTVSLYLNPMRQEGYVNHLISLKPKRIIFNPGTENQAFLLLAQQNGIETVQDCTLVMLSSGTF